MNTSIERNAGLKTMTRLSSGLSDRLSSTQRIISLPRTRTKGFGRA